MIFVIGILIGFVIFLIRWVVKEIIRSIRFWQLEEEWLEIHAELLDYMANDQRLNAIAAFKRLRAVTDAQMKLVGQEVTKDAP